MRSRLFIGRFTSSVARINQICPRNVGLYTPFVNNNQISKFPFECRQFHKAVQLRSSQKKQQQNFKSDEPIEEETLTYYESENYYPAHIGQTIQGRYLIIGKLGYGSSSTTWLCRDLRNKSYVSLKIYVKSPHSINWEVMIYRHLEGIQSDHIGRKYIRRVLDDIELEGPDGSRHCCLVHPPMLTTLWEYLSYEGKKSHMTLDELRALLRILFRALDYLHTEANVTHCDVKASNLMFPIKDNSLLEEFERDEGLNPSVRKVINDDRTIYASRRFQYPRNHDFGFPILCDFGESRIGGDHKYEEILPTILRPPEILLEMNWSYGVDVWSAGCMAWDIFERTRLFNGGNSKEKYSERNHLAEMVAYLGEPPLIFQLRSPVSHLVFGKDGAWKGPPSLPRLSIHDSETRLQGQQQKNFLEFMLYMLRWQPDERLSAQHLLETRWLNGSN